MISEPKSKLTRESFQIPKHVIRTGKILQFFSTSAATNFALKMFKTPPKFQIPEREEMMRQSAKKEIITIPTINKEINKQFVGFWKTPDYPGVYGLKPDRLGDNMQKVSYTGR